MITAGIDIGLENIKVVILRDRHVAATATALSGGAVRGQAAAQTYQEALRSAGLTARDVEQVVATGQGKYDAKWATGRSVESVADARAARFLFPAATAVVDIGADQTRVVTLGEGDNITEVVLNQKCAAGLGLFLESIARRLGMSLGEMSSLPPDGDAARVINDGCAVFAELDALGLLNRDMPPADVARAVIEMAAVRVNSILNDKIKPAPDTTVLVGGVSRNKAFVKALERRSGIRFLIPAHPEYAGALGAAVIGARNFAKAGQGGLQNG